MEELEFAWITNVLERSRNTESRVAVAFAVVRTIECVTAVALINSTDDFKTFQKHHHLVQVGTRKRMVLVLAGNKLTRQCIVVQKDSQVGESLLRKRDFRIEQPAEGSKQPMFLQVDKYRVVGRSVSDPRLLVQLAAGLTAFF